MNILITSASRKVQLIKAFQCALASEGGGMVITIDASPSSASLYFADKSYIAPSGLGENFLEAVQKICKKHNVQLLIPTRDEELPFFAALKESFAEMGVTIMVSNQKTVQICQDKRLFVHFCQEHGFSVPQTFTNPNKINQFPVFVKERFGKGSKGAFRIENKTELDNLLPHLKDPLVQEYIEAPEYTVDLFADFSGKVISVVPRERLLIMGGESFIGKTSKNWDIINEAIRLARTLQLTGHNTIQCFWHKEEAKFIEVNPRYGGAANLGFAAGAFTPQMLIRLILNKEVAPIIGEFEDNLYMLRYTEDVFVNEEKIKGIEQI